MVCICIVSLQSHAYAWVSQSCEQYTPTHPHTHNTDLLGKAAATLKGWGRNLQELVYGDAHPSGQHDGQRNGQHQGESSDDEEFFKPRGHNAGGAHTPVCLLL